MSTNLKLYIILRAGSLVLIRIACYRRLDSREQMKSYVASAKRNTRGKNEGRLGLERENSFLLAPSLFPPYFFPLHFFTRALIFRPLPTIWTPGTVFCPPRKFSQNSHKWACSQAKIVWVCYWLCRLCGQVLPCNISGIFIQRNIKSSFCLYV